jgi:ketosteroid isomerase-like protein
MRAQWQQRGVSAKRILSFLALVDPNVEFTPGDVELESGGPYRGHEGFRSWLEEELRVFPDFSAKIEQIRGVGDRTIALVRVRGRGMGSDVPAEGMSWQVTKWRNGKAIRFRDFRSESEALEAAGLSE